ncbi:hypothetical protein EDC01DRAFT_630258 [Geopyxis carbonaria]|nr:hypothetical protein EDC01DRAFT_630258 [Geopyxis carbonaria]
MKLLNILSLSGFLFTAALALPLEDPPVDDANDVQPVPTNPEDQVNFSTHNFTETDPLYTTYYQIDPADTTPLPEDGILDCSPENPSPHPVCSQPKTIDGGIARYALICQTKWPYSPPATSINLNVDHLRALGNRLCCQIHRDRRCTRMAIKSNAATDICTGFGVCTTCLRAAQYNYRIAKHCNQWGRAQGYVADATFDVNVYMWPPFVHQPNIPT